MSRARVQAHVAHAQHMLGTCSAYRLIVGAGSIGAGAFRAACG